MLTAGFEQLPSPCHLALTSGAYLNLYDAMHTRCPACRNTDKAEVIAFTNHDHTEYRRILVCPSCEHTRPWP